MGKAFALAGVCWILFVVTGCGTEPAGEQTGPAPEVLTEPDVVFPEFLAGAWRTDNGRWGLTFNRDGSLSSIKHYYISVPIDVEEGGVHEPLKDDFYAVYVLGPCQADYFPGTRELEVNIAIDSFQVTLPEGDFEGKMHDRLIGPVSADGKSWDADWLSYGEISGLGRDDPNKTPSKSLIFTKVD